MSTATKVPETWNLTGDDAVATLRRVGFGRLARDAWMRLRFADGFSHARSLAYTISLVLVQAIIGLLGLASALGAGDTNGTLVRTLPAAVPGPGGAMLTRAVQQAHTVGSSGQYLGIVFGLCGALVTGATLMGQLERGLNRLYGVEQDRPTFQKYCLATGLALSAGFSAILAFACLAVGRDAFAAVGNDVLRTAWAVVRWPLGLAFVALSMSIVLRCCPRRRQPGWSWLALAAAVSVLLWSAVTAGLGLVFSLSGSFGRTYGPFAGIVGLLLWAFLSAVAVLFGASLAAQLEAVRVGEPTPQDAEKVEHSEPGMAVPVARVKVSA